MDFAQTTNDAKLLQILEARYEQNKNNPKKVSGLAARMQALQEYQQREQEEIKRRREELERRKKGKK